MTTLVVDCSALCYSSAYALVGMETNEVETSVLFGFLRQIRSLSEKFSTNDVVFCWDSKISKRRDLFPEYKLKRRKEKQKAKKAAVSKQTMSEVSRAALGHSGLSTKSEYSDPKQAEIAAVMATIHAQIDKLKNDILPASGFRNSFEQDGLEADDLLADIVLGYPNCIIIANDEDMWQMLEYCNIYQPGKKRLLNAGWFIMEYGIKPHLWAEVKTLGGCKTDEVPGIPIPDDKGGWSKKGVGEGTAIKYLNGKLPSHWKAFKAMESEHGKSVAARNRPLVTLPFYTTRHIELVDNDFDIEQFWKMCIEFKFESFMRGAEKKRWENFFRGNL